MKTLITLLTATALVAGVTNAMADQQSSDESAGYLLSHSIGVGGAYASARVPGRVRNSTVSIPSAIDFQAQGSH